MGRSNFSSGRLKEEIKRRHSGGSTWQTKLIEENFVKQTVAGTAMLAGASAGALEAAAAAPMDPNKQVVAALGSVFIPSKRRRSGLQGTGSPRDHRLRHEEVSGRRCTRRVQYGRQAILRRKSLSGSGRKAAGAISRPDRRRKQESPMRSSERACRRFIAARGLEF